MTAQPEKVDLKSIDIASEKLERLKAVMPEVFAEGKIDWEQLQRALGKWVEPGKERFGLNWPGKADCMKVIQQPSVATLKPAPEESVDFDTTENLFIEGDNLEVLKLLQKSYFGKVKMIYIDPPYNTGKEFIYPDKYAENLDTYLAYTGQTDAEGRKFSTNTDAVGRYHSNWLNMMYPRLYLARNLMRDDGVIFISIGEEEVCHLRCLCNDIFGEYNFVCEMIRRSKIGGGSDNKQIAKEADYILVYAKNIDAINEFSISHTEEDLKRYKESDELGKYFWDTYSRSGLIDSSKDKESDSLYYAVTFPDGTSRSDRWRRSKERLALDLDKGDAKFVQTKEGWNIHFKQRLNEGGKRPRQILFNDFSNGEGTKDFRSLFGEIEFSYPKPVSLIKFLIEICSNKKGDVILDFFAGSSATAHGVLAQVASDGIKRQFVMVQLPERLDNSEFSTIAQVSKERIRRAAKKIAEEREGQLDLDGNGKLDLGFKVFKLDRSNFKVWDGDVEALGDDTKLAEQLSMHVDHIGKASTVEDILYELLLKAGFPLTTRVEKLELAGKEVFSIHEGAMLICLDKDITSELIDALAEANPLQVICLDEGFKGNDQLKANAVQTFKARAQEEESEIVFRTV